MTETKKYDIAKITTQNGLLYYEGKMVSVFEADQIAREHGYVYAEEMVRALEEAQKGTLK